MSFKETLVEAGFSEGEAERLVNDDWFAQRNSNKSAEEIRKEIKTIASTYLTTETDIRKAVLSHPQFAGLDHQRVLKGIKDVYNCTQEQASKAVLSHHSFAGYDHQRVLKGIKDAYGCTQEQASKAVLSFPQFAGLDHQRVLRQLGRIGKIVDMDRNEVKRRILERPVLAGYSAKRYLAAIDIGRELRKEGINSDKILSAWPSYYAKSPYVPDTNRLSITKAAKRGINGEPPLMTAMRNKLRAAG